MGLHLPLQFQMQARVGVNKRQIIGQNHTAAASIQKDSLLAKMPKSMRTK